MYKQLASLLILAVLLPACGDDSPAGSTPATIVVAKPGSTFTYESYRTDTTSGLPIESTRDTTIMTVARTGLALKGRTGVTEATVTDEFGTDTSYYVIGANNDVSTYFRTDDFLVPVEGWYTIPNSSKTAITSTIIDTTIIDVDTSRGRMAFTATYLGEENMTVKGASIKVAKISMQVHQSMTSSTAEITINYGYTLYFAPSLGVIAKMESPVLSGGGFKETGSYTGLIDYSLK